MFDLKIINSFLEYPYKYKNTLAPMLIFFLVFYGGNAGPKLPQFIVSLFQNPVFRVFVLSLIVYKGNKNPTVAILIAVGFTLIMDRINKQNFSENFSIQIENFTNKETEFEKESTIDSTNDLETKSNELDDLNDNDNEEFKEADSCNGLCSKINYNEFEEKIRSDEFSQDYFNTIKDCMVVDLLQNKSNTEVKQILKKMDLTHNDIDGPIGTAYVNYTDAITRLNI